MKHRTFAACIIAIATLFLTSCYGDGEEILGKWYTHITDAQRIELDIPQNPEQHDLLEIEIRDQEMLLNGKTLAITKTHRIRSWVIHERGSAGVDTIRFHKTGDVDFIIPNHYHTGVTKFAIQRSKHPNPTG